MNEVSLVKKEVRRLSSQLSARHSFSKMEEQSVPTTKAIAEVPYDTLNDLEALRQEVSKMEDASEPAAVARRPSVSEEFPATAVSPTSVTFFFHYRMSQPNAMRQKFEDLGLSGDAWDTFLGDTKRLPPLVASPALTCAIAFPCSLLCCVPCWGVPLVRRDLTRKRDRWLRAATDLCERHNATFDDAGLSLSADANGRAPNGWEGPAITIWWDHPEPSPPNPSLSPTEISYRDKTWKYPKDAPLTPEKRSVPKPPPLSPELFFCCTNSAARPISVNTTYDDLRGGTTYDEYTHHPPGCPLEVD